VVVLEAVAVVAEAEAEGVAAEGVVVAEAGPPEPR